MRIWQSFVEKSSILDTFEVAFDFNSDAFFFLAILDMQSILSLYTGTTGR